MPLRMILALGARSMSVHLVMFESLVVICMPIAFGIAKGIGAFGQLLSVLGMRVVTVRLAGALQLAGYLGLFEAVDRRLA